jgi:ABC-2 type transport system permease protein
LTTAGVEWSKLEGQFTPRAVIGACVAAPFSFVLAIRMQSSVPEDTLFGRAAKDSGYATPLIVLAFAGLWLLPVLGSVVCGDLFSAEDRHRTWPTVLTRSRSRAEVFGGKVLAGLLFSSLAVAVLAASSLAAGVLIIGRQPLVDLSGVLVLPAGALNRIALAWTSVLPPVLGFAGLAVLSSVATRSGAAGIGLPILTGMVMQLCAFLDGPEALRRLLITASFGAWHGLLTQPPYYGPLVCGTVVSVGYVVVSVGVAYRLFRRRDFGG